MTKQYRLLSPSGAYDSLTPGLLGGNRTKKLYGRLDCPSALRWVAKGTYQKSRVFFADEATAIACGYRPCSVCLRKKYREWKARQPSVPNTATQTRARPLPRSLLLKHHVLVDADNPFQQRARLLQALWREENGLPIGARDDGTPLGSRLPVDVAKSSGVNLMTPASRAAATHASDAARNGSRQLIEEGRLWANLLSSQPLAFNLFAELAADLDCATRVCRRLWPARVVDVTRILFEHSPDRGSPKYTADNTAFDVFVEHSTRRGGRGFLGIEVKYHEAMNDNPAKHRPRYDELTRAMACFNADHLATLRAKPIHQMWRDHMLAGAMMLDADARWESGAYVFLAPADNRECARAVERYREHLADAASFATATLEAVVDAIERETDAQWIRSVRERYLAWEKIERVVASQEP